jgi:hypothetical protein
MLSTVQLDYQPGGEADKVHDMRSDRLLAFEFVGSQPVSAQMRPEAPLRVRHPAA